MQADVKNGCPLLGKPLNYICALLLAISFSTAANTKSMGALQWYTKYKMSDMYTFYKETFHLYDIFHL